MKKQLISTIRIILILVLLVVCAAAALGVLAVDQVPSLVSRRFGPAGAGLSTPQRIIYSFRLLALQKSLLTPVDPQGKPQAFNVTLGESVNSISARLEEEKLITNAEAFRTYLIYAGLDKGVQAGKYQLSPAMTTLQIAHSLQDATPEEVEFNILPGWRAEEVAAALPTSGLAITPVAFMDIVRQPPADVFPPGLPLEPSLEGFMLPGTYQVKRGATAHDLAALFLKRFNEAVTQDLRDAFQQQGLDLYNAVSLASMVQREAVVSDEQPVIASVFYNRLQQGMKLDSDPTVQFALGYSIEKQSWWKNPLSQSDLQVDSRYNTYVNPGLPPGPICSPGLDALRAVAHPAQTGYFYFRAKCDGSGRHAFSATYEEHLLNACP